MFWERPADEVTLPVWKVYALPVINAAHISVGRITEARALTHDVRSLVAEMETASQLTRRCTLATHKVLPARDELDEAQRQALSALEVAHVDQPPIAAVDALDLLSIVSQRRGPASPSSIGQAVAAGVCASDTTSGPSRAYRRGRDGDENDGLI